MERRVRVKHLLHSVHETHVDGGGTLSGESLRELLHGALPEGWAEGIPGSLAIHVRSQREAGGRFSLSGGPFGDGDGGWRLEAPPKVEGLYVSFPSSLSLFFEPEATISYRLGALSLPVTKLALDRFQVRMSLAGRRDGFAFLL